MKRLLKNTRSKLTQRERNSFYRFLGLNLLINALDIASLGMLVFIVDFYTKPGSQIQPSYLPSGLGNNNSIALILLFLLFFAGKNYAAYIIKKKEQSYFCNVVGRISQNNMWKYLEGTYSNFVSSDSGSHSWRIGLQPYEFSQHVLAGLQQIFTEGVMILMAIIAILIFNANLFLILVAFLVPPVIFVSYLLKKRLNLVRNKIKDGRETMWLHLQEAVNGFIDSNIYGKNDHFITRFSKSQRTVNNNIANMQVVQALPSRFIEIFAVVGMFALVLVSKSKTGATLDIITLGAFVAAAYKVIPGIVKIINLNNQVKNYAFTLDDLPEPETENPVKALQPTIESILFRNVIFQPNHNSPIQKINFELCPGDFIAITGLSGKGKTTMLNLLLGFLQQHQGEILINNKITTLDERKSFWNRVAYVQQQPFIINDTVISNITLNGEHNDHGKLEKAIQVTGISDWLSEQEAGLNYLVRDNGKNISGGQRKRISIARALYIEADLYLLDEAFSELDEDSEQEILQHFYQLSQAGKMVILISHSKSSFKYCNKIISLDEERTFT